MGCAEGAPETGARIEIINGDGVPVPKYLLFDWMDDERVLVANRRVPEKGFLDPGATPLAVVRIASGTGGDAQRSITVRGMIEDLRVSEGTASVRIMPGSWRETTVVLTAAEPQPDGGAPPDGAAADAADDAPDAADDADPVDLAADLPTEVGPDPPDGGPPDTQTPDLLRDLPPDLPPTGPVTIAPSADSYVEQGQTSAGMNFGKAAILEVKTQNGADNSRIAYLRFPLAAVNGAVTNATLRLYGKSSTANTMESAFAVMDDAWTETGINWNNKPALGAKQFTVTVTTTAQYREWNVTAIVKSQQAAGRPTINLAVSMDMDTSAAPDTHNSKEAASNPPQLVVNR
jgi:hypothetical protein